MAIRNLLVILLVSSPHRYAITCKHSISGQLDQVMFGLEGVGFQSQGFVE